MKEFNNKYIKEINQCLRDLVKYNLDKKNINYSFLNSAIKNSSKSIFRKKELYQHYQDNLYYEVNEKTIKLYISLKYDKNKEYFIFFKRFNRENETIEEAIEKKLKEIKYDIEDHCRKFHQGYSLYIDLNDVNRVVDELMKNKLIKFLNINNNVKF